MSGCDAVDLVLIPLDTWRRLPPESDAALVHGCLDDVADPIDQSELHTNESPYRRCGACLGLGSHQ